jgi:FixJ family two-component response regulator
MAGQLICVIDDDESVRESLPDLLGVLGFQGKAFASAKEFLESGSIRQAQCLLLDVAMPGMSGPELHLQLLQRRDRTPIIFITARADQTVREQLIAQGAVECLFKPFSEQQLRAALAKALQSN